MVDNFHFDYYVSEGEFSYAIFQVFNFLKNRHFNFLLSIFPGSLFSPYLTITQNDIRHKNMRRIKKQNKCMKKEMIAKNFIDLAKFTGL